MLLAHVSRWLDDYRFLEPEPPSHPLVQQIEALPEGTPEQIAARAREVIGLDNRSPVRDICGLLESSGIRVLVLHRQSDDFFGLSVGGAEGGPAVVVNAWKRISVERWIFSAAHELGHLLLHPADFDGAAMEESHESEQEADRFASAFLMPEPAFTAAWNQTRGHDLVTRVLKVKRLFRVSYRTVLHRLQATRRTPRGIWGRFQVEYRHRTGRTLRRSDEPHPLDQSEFAWNWRSSGEPAGLEPHDFIEDRLAGLVRRAVEAHRITLSRAAEVLDLDLAVLIPYVAADIEILTTSVCRRRPVTATTEVTSCGLCCSCEPLANFALHVVPRRLTSIVRCDSLKKPAHKRMGELMCPR